MSLFKTNKQRGQDYFTSEHIKSNLKKSAVKGAGATVLNQTVAYGIQMVSTIILARLLSPEDFGLVAMALSVKVIFRMFRNLGLMDATIQKESINHRQISTLFWVNTGFGFLLTLTFISIAPIIAWFYKAPELKLIVVWLSLDFFFGGISTQQRALLKRNLQMYRWALNETCAIAISFSIAIFLAWQGWSYWALVVRHVSGAVLQTIGAWLICAWRPGLPARGTGILPMLKFGRNMIGNYFVNYFTENLDKILIGWRHGAQSLGFYHKAYHLFLAPTQQLAVPLMGVAVATLSRLCNEPEKYRRYYLKAVGLVAFVGMPLSALLTVMGNDIIYLLLGPQWGKTGEIFSVFGFGIGIQILYATHSWLHVSQGRTDRWLRWSIVASFVTIISFIIGFPFGAIGVAAAYTASLYILIGPSLWYAGLPINLSFTSIVSSTWKYYTCATFAGLLCWYLVYFSALTSPFFTGIHISLRLILASCMFSVLYFASVIAIYRGIGPIREFISVLYEMVPKLNRK